MSERPTYEQATQALQMVDQAVASLPLNRAQHQQLLAAVQTLAKAIQPPDPPEQCKPSQCDREKE